MHRLFDQPTQEHRMSKERMPTFFPFRDMTNNFNLSRELECVDGQNSNLCQMKENQHPAKKYASTTVASFARKVPTRRTTMFWTISIALAFFGFAHPKGEPVDFQFAFYHFYSDSK
jgi:hypothetical protein